MRGRSILLFAFAAVLGACEDDASSTTSAPSTPPIDGGTTTSRDGAAPPGDDGGTVTTGECPLTSGDYAVMGNALFRTTGDLLLAENVATIVSPKTGQSLSGTVLHARAGGGTLVVSSTDCPLCKVEPGAIVDRKVTAELLKDGISPALLGDSDDAQIVLVVTGTALSPNYAAFSLGTKEFVVNASPKIPASGSGVTCSGITAVSGSVLDGKFDVHFLAECADASSAPVSTFIHTNGTYTVAPYVTTPDAHQVIASSKASAKNYAVDRMDAKRAMFVAGKEVLKLDGAGGFALDGRAFAQCNPNRPGEKIPGTLPVF